MRNWVGIWRWWKLARLTLILRLMKFSGRKNTRTKSQKTKRQIKMQNPASDILSFVILMTRQKHLVMQKKVKFVSLQIAAVVEKAIEQYTSDACLRIFEVCAQRRSET